MNNKIPNQFGKRANTNELDFNEEIEKYRRVDVDQLARVKKQVTFEKPMSGIGPSKPSVVDSDSSSSDDEPDINNPYYKKKEAEIDDIAKTGLSSEIPSSHEVIIHGHKKAVTALDIDPKGYRMISGSYDYNVRLWDFNGMNKSMNSFRILEPYEGQPIQKLLYSNQGDEFMVITNSSQVKIYDRDGRDLHECVKGDMYINDLSNTRGHTAMIKDGQWNPVEPGKFMTCSLDSTVRFWDTSTKKIGVEQQLKHVTVIKMKNNMGKKIACTSCCYTSDGRTIAVNCNDGSLHIYSARSYFARAELSVPVAHIPEKTAGSMVFSKDGTKLLTRACDNTMKIWDLRSFKKPLNIWYDLPAEDYNTKVTYSPNEKYIMTGISVTKPSDLGAVHFYNSTTFEKEGQLTVSDSSVTQMIWHPILNQLFVTSADHEIHVYCDPEKSQRGALLCINRQERQKKAEDIDYTPDIRTPHALPSFKDENKNRRRKMEKFRNDPIATRHPEAPPTGRNKGGKVQGPSTVTQYIMLTQNKNEEIKEDVREALIKLDAETRQNPDLVGVAYKDTQPVTIFDYNQQQVEEQELLSSIQKICPGCGLKICRCGLSMRPLSNNRSIFNQGDGA